MKIGFDAKRAFQNTTGLGHYSRTLVASLAQYFPENDYYLFAPKITSLFKTGSFNNIHAIAPGTFPSTMLKSLWRSNLVKNDLLNNHIDIYHGLSHEIPFDIHKTKIRSVVTIHDLIFERYPDQYSVIDRSIYRNKFRYSCNKADKIIAISEQTKEDIIQYYKIPENKITVCYQSCNPAFTELVSAEKKQAVAALYKLPKQFYLYVGSIIERKNLLLICKALKQLEASIPLVVIGDGGPYKQQVKQYIRENALDDRVIFLSETPAARSSVAFKTATDFPAIYRQATAMIYPSIFEGFGIPVLEALCSKLPVITSNQSCLPETGGNAALYINPANETELADAMRSVANDDALKNSMIEKGIVHATNFTQQKCAGAVMDVYKKL